jgi:hypothetical protein
MYHAVVANIHSPSPSAIDMAEDRRVIFIDVYFF